VDAAAAPSPRPRRFRPRRFDRWLAAAVLAGGALYVGGAWSASSYALVLQSLGAADTGLRVGVPRSERGDEFGWHTPLIQSAVRNGFRRYDRLPPYTEDLRTVVATPLADWGLPFKPTLWGFFVLPPAYAYSLYHYLPMASFVVGWTYLLAALGLGKREGLFFSLAIAFTAFTQYWWNGWANLTEPFFPWVVLAFLSRLHPVVKGLVISWLLTSWLVLFLYPPAAMAHAFVGAALVLAVRPEALTRRNLLALLGGAAAAGLAIWLYLGHVLVTLGRTQYPGHRFSGGGGVEFLRFLSQFFPTVQVDHHVLLTPGSLCEQAMMGTFYVLLVVCFLDYRGLLHAGRRTRRAVAGLLVAFLMTQAWQLLPLPWWVGAPLLWHRVTPGRLSVAAGLTCVLFAAVAARRGRLRVTWIRFAAFAALVLAVWFRFKRQVGFNGWIDVAILVPAGYVVYTARARGWHSHRVNRAFLLSAAAVGLLAFGDYNPVQSTHPIFERPSTWMTRALDRRMQDGCTTIVVPFGWSFFGHTGSPLVGLGYPSLAHATFEPHLAFWRKLFPEMPADEFDRMFNNVGVFVAGDTAEPRRVPGTLATEVPIRTVIERGAGYPCLFAGARRALGAGAFAVRWALPEVPATVRAGDVLRVPVRVTNIGNDIWPDRAMADPEAQGGWAVRLTSRWRTEEKDGDYRGRFDLRRPVFPGETVTILALPQAPAKPGAYTLEFDLLQENVAVFSDQGAPPASVPIRVVAGAETTRDPE
jgi:hypothetical protein